MKLTNAQIEQRVSLLPDNIKHAIKAFDWSGKIIEIGNKYDLQIDELEIFRMRTLEVIIGESSASNYEPTLKRELEVSGDVARDLVLEANQHIFGELQKRAFSSPEETTQEKTKEYYSGDPYHEPIGHDDVRASMREEGIELLDHDDPLIQESDITSPVTEPVFKMPTQTPAPSRDYQETIEDTDLRGVKQQGADTSILKTLNLSSPDNMLKGDDLPGLADEKSILKNTLDEELFTQSHIPKGDTIDLSPSESEEIIDSGTFLNHLSEALPTKDTE
ncbi:MAG: hypothetical protein ACJAXB_002448 [Candidatus Endobugula sp.]|jgi:hypothetical protein